MIRHITASAVPLLLAGCASAAPAPGVPGPGPTARASGPPAPATAGAIPSAREPATDAAGPAAPLLREARAQLELRTREANERAVELYRQAVDADPNSAEAHRGLGQAHLQRVQTYSMPRLWLDTAEVHLRRAVALDPQGVEPRLALSSALFWRGRYPEVAGIRRSLYQLDPTPASATALASILWHVRELPEALRLLEGALPAYPNSAMVRWHLGYVNWYLGRTDEAIRWFQQALVVSPEFPRAHSAIAYVLLSEGRTEDARRQIRRALEQQPDEPEQLLNAGMIEVFAGDLQAAREYLERYQQAAPGARRTPKHYLAYVHQRQGRGAEADRLLRELLDGARAAVEDGDESWPLAYSMAQVHALKGDADEALGWMERAVAGGWMEWGFATHDPLLAALHGTPRFQQLMQTVRDRAATARAEVERSPG